MRQLIVLSLFFTLCSFVDSLGQQIDNFKVNNATLSECIKIIQKDTKMGFFYDANELDKNKRITVEMKNSDVNEILTKILKDTGFGYKLINNYIVISKLKSPENTQQKVQKINGTITDKKGNPLPGVSIVVKGTTLGVSSDVDGKFKLEVPSTEKTTTLIFSFIGMKTKEVKIKDDKPLKIVMEENAEQLEDVVVTGYFNKSKESFTGAVKTMKVEDMQKVGALNVLQALGSLDPSLRIAENLEFGSDPNRIPEITIRGDNGFDLRDAADADRTNPNAPLYVLDGVEVSAQRVYDLDMNRIDQMTVLKDASATALYGSRGANGVIVITTKRPKAGEVKISFNSNFNFSIPDLRDYNLMNSEEKLQYEKLAGVWDDPTNNYVTQMDLDKKFNEKLKEVRRGVNTYWLSKPLQTSVNKRYSTYFEGGDNSFRYGINLRYDSDKGVMKKSGRTKYGIDITFNYNIGSNFFIRNDVLISDVKGENSPYGSFSKFAKENPHDRIYDEDGNYNVFLSSGNKNPLIDADLPNISEDKYTSIQDNFNIDWKIANSFRFKGRLSYTKQINKKTIYRSPFSTDFVTTEKLEEKGKYEIDNSDQHNFDGNFTLSYFKCLNKHILNIGVGSNFTTFEKMGEGFTATGFINDEMNFIRYASQYLKEGTPRGISDKSKMIGFFGNLNYGFDNRYFIDLSYRTDGSSKFGKNSQFAPFWSTGFAWNLNKEHWWNNELNTLKIRGSVGSTGSVNFSSSQALTTYSYNSNSKYNGIFGAELMGFGNKSLKWQNTFSYNTGLDLTLFQNRIQFNVDAYIKITDNLLLPIDVAPSTGFRSYTENMGEMKNTGIEGRLRLVLIQDKINKFNWSTTLAAFHNTNKIQKLSNSMQAINEIANSEDAVTAYKPLPTYQVGRSQTALMVVRSGGIDPATGKEVYIKLNGERTFKYDYKDKIIVGDTKPDVEGNIISNLNWRGFNLYMQFRYEYGAKAYNSTLAQKVEQANPRMNADRRVLYERWKEPGDEVIFKRIGDTSPTYQTSRLVQDNDLFSLQSLSASYTLSRNFCKKYNIERLKLTVSTTDLFRFSTIKRERGTIYPFARTFSLGLNMTI